jgi:hypothetical protein
MVANDDAGSLTPSGVPEFIASRLAPTGDFLCITESEHPATIRLRQTR